VGETVVARTRGELASARGAAGGRVGVVMTMGALHDGHVQLIRAAREACDVVVVTIFLNPLQFGPNEDLARYPRTFDADLALCTREGVDLVFAPGPDVVYPDGDPGVRVSAGRLGDVLEGASRPGHFDGVLTVVAKLLHLTRPEAAYFGQKDAQQLLLIRRMVRDLDFGVEIAAVPTVREPDGLAMSSRNMYLTPLDREVALSLVRALRAGEAAAPEGASAVRRAARAVLVAEPLARADYLVLVHPESLEDVAEWYRGPALLAVAARVGTTRLIDNALLTVGRDAATAARVG
jgi:pantoate--beta-alanine ligase